MALKLTKNEQKKQKDALFTYTRFLPTLQLKKKQLQSVISSFRDEFKKVQKESEELENSISQFYAIFSQNKSLANSGLYDLVKVKKIITQKLNIAGVNIPSFENVEFEEIEYDFLIYPLWVDKAICAVKDTIKSNCHLTIISRAIMLLEKELKTTTERVNLFEKIKIPETRQNIRKISIALSDLDTSAVVRGKISQKKLQGGDL